MQKTIAFAFAIAMQIFTPNFGYCFGGPQTLQNFSIFANSLKYNLKARGLIASIGSFVPVLASQNVVVEIENVKTKKVTSYLCTSFTFEITDSFTTCEIAGAKKTLAIDFDNSQFNSYPLKP